MTIVQNAITGRSRRQSGGMVFRTMHGKNIMQAKPFIYRDLKSDSQLRYRALQTKAFRWANSIKLYLMDLGIDKQSFPSTRSRYHSILSALRKIIYIDVTTPKFCANLIDLGVDEIAPCPYTEIVCEGSNVYTINWDDELQQTPKNDTDLISIVVLSLDSNEFMFLPDVAERSDNTYILNTASYFGEYEKIMILTSVSNAEKTLHSKMWGSAEAYYNDLPA